MAPGWLYHFVTLLRLRYVALADAVPRIYYERRSQGDSLRAGIVNVVHARERFKVVSDRLGEMDCWETYT